jgi:hypothetical protein
LPPPQRQGHPNRRIEAEFQRIVSLRRAIARAEAELDAAQTEIPRLRRRARREGWSDVGRIGAQEQADALEARVPELDAKIRDLHDPIAKAVEPFSDDDLLFL